MINILGSLFSHSLRSLPAVCRSSAAFFPPQAQLAPYRASNPVWQINAYIYSRVNERANKCIYIYIHLYKENDRPQRSQMERTHARSEGARPMPHYVKIKSCWHTCTLQCFTRFMNLTFLQPFVIMILHDQSPTSSFIEQISSAPASPVSSRARTWVQSGLRNTPASFLQAHGQIIWQKWREREREIV